ncbi:PAS domain-containing protein [bacterium]|nr:PAS domain-containing protein [bacterium]
MEAVREEITLRTGGEDRAFQMHLSPLYDRSGNLSGRAIVLHDVTDLKRINQELEAARIKADESTRLKSEFLATMSHELRTPLNAILGYAGLMKMGALGPLSDGVIERVGRIEKSGQHLLNLINDILDLSKIEAGRMEIVEKPAALREMIHDWQQQVVVLAEDKGLPLIVRVDPTLPPTLIVDREHLSQVMLNLLSNAVKFTEAGNVMLDAQRDGDDHWWLRVSDTGIGIPQEAQAFIFDEFRQVDASDQRIHNGTGLGLAIVNRLTELMGGEVSLESQVGVGSSFTVRLPLHCPEPLLYPEPTP